MNQPETKPIRQASSSIATATFPTLGCQFSRVDLILSGWTVGWRSLGVVKESQHQKWQYDFTIFYQRSATGSRMSVIMYNKKAHQPN